MKIKNINEFERLDEGLLSSLVSGVKNLFTSKKSKLESIIKKIRESRNEEISNAISIEKEINSLNRDSSPEYNFSVTNLRRQSRSYASIKGQEINSLVKEARNIIEEDAKLESFFQSELAKVEVETREKLINNLRGLSDTAYLSQ